MPRGERPGQRGKGAAGSGKEGGATRWKGSISADAEERGRGWQEGPDPNPSGQGLPGPQSDGDVFPAEPRPWSLRTPGSVKSRAELLRTVAPSSGLTALGSRLQGESNPKT